MTTLSHSPPAGSRALIPVAHWLLSSWRDTVYFKADKRLTTGDCLNLSCRREVKRLQAEADAVDFRAVTNPFALLLVDHVVIVGGRSDSVRGWLQRSLLTLPSTLSIVRRTCASGLTQSQ